MAIKKSNWDKIAKDKTLYNQLTEDNKRIFWEYGSTQGLLPKQSLGSGAITEMSKYIKADFYNPKYISKVTQEADQAEPTYKTPTDKFANVKPLPSKKLEPTPKPLTDSEKRLKSGLTQVGAMKRAESKKVATAQAVATGKIQTDAEMQKPKLPSLNRAERAKDNAKQRLAEEKVQKEGQAKALNRIEAIQNEIAEIEKSSNYKPTTEQQKKIKALSDESFKLVGIAKPKSLRFAQGLSFGTAKPIFRATMGEEAGKAFDTASKQKGAVIGDITGSLFAQNALGSLIAPFLKSSKVGQAILGGENASAVRKLFGSQGANITLDTLIESPRIVVDAIDSGKDLPETAKELLLNTTFNIGLNLLLDGRMTADAVREMLGNSKVLNTLKQANIEPETVAKAIADNDTETIKQIRDTIYVNPQGGASKSLARAEMPLDVPTNQLALPAPKDISKMETTTSKVEISATEVDPLNQLKNKQLDVINKTNPAPNDYNTWIRSTNDIKTHEEVFGSNFEEIYPDFTEEMAADVLRTGKIKIYSSYPIENGVFVTPSKMEAKSYAGSNKVYEKTVDAKDVAWINQDEGQFAKVATEELEPPKPDFDFSAKVTKEIPRNVTPAELTEQRLLDLQNRVRSGQIPQDEAESVAKQLIDEMEAPKPQSSIAQQGKIEPNRSVLPQGDAMARVDTLPTKSTDLPTSTADMSPEKLMEFRLNFFGATAKDPMQAAVNGKLVNVIGAFEKDGVRYAALSNGTRVSLDEVFPTSIIKQVGDGKTLERGFSENIRTDANRNDELRELFDKDKLFYQQLSNKTTLEKAQAIYDQGYESAIDHLRKTSNQLRVENVPLSKMIADEAMRRGDTEVAREMIIKTAESLTEAGRFSQAAKILRESDSPSTILEFVEKELARLNREGAQRYGKKWSTIDLDEADWNVINQFGKGATDEEKEILFEQLFDNIVKKVPTTNREKFDSFRRMAMLLNPKTHVRNVLGNTLMATMKTVADKTAAVGERALLKPDQYTKSIKSASKESLAKASDYFTSNKKDLLEGSRWDIFGVKSPFADKPTFKTGWLQTLNDASMKALEAEDVFFMKNHFVRDLAGFMDARNLKEPTEEAVAYALRRAQEATFREANELAKAINKLKGTRYGLIVEAAVPFTKTPANILKSGVQYSPIGAVQGAIELATKADPALAIETFSKGLTGSALTALGFFMAKNGLARGDYNKGKAEALEQATGNLPNSIILPNGSYTIDWAQPSAIPFFMGVAMAEEFEKNKDASMLDASYKALLAGGETMINQSMLRNIKDLFGGYGTTAEKIASLPLDYAMQGMPTVAGQLARTVDPVKRQLDYSSPLKKITSTIQSRTPQASKSLPPKYDLLGQVMKQGEGASNAFNQFLNPGFVGKRTTDPTLLEIERVANEVGTSAIPRSSVSDFTYKKEKYELTPTEKSEFQKVMGQHTKKKLDLLFNQSKYKSMDDDKKAKAIKDINDEGYDLAKQAILKLRKK